MIFYKKKIVGIILLILVISIGIFYVIFNIPILKSPTSGVILTKINESGIPKGMIIHLSDKDFEEFPSLAPIIRDNTKRGIVYANGTRIDYSIKLSWEDKEKFISKYYPMESVNYTGKSEYFEYKGNYYSYTPPFQL
jgi:hypothetical protein